MVNTLPAWIDRRPPEIEEVLLDSLDARGNAKREREAEQELARRIWQTVVVAHLLGRESTWKDYDRFRVGRFAAEPIDPFNIPFTEAIEDIVTREPRVVPPGIINRMGWISELYSETQAFAAARSATLKLTARVQDAITRLTKEGLTPQATETEIMEIAAEEAQPWTRSYAATVYRTNASTNYSNGRFAQARDPVVREVIGALQFIAQEDERVRPHHIAAHETIAPVDDPVWQIIKPPLGYQCRCGTIFKNIFELERMGLVENGIVRARYSENINEAHPDKGFKPGVF